LEYLVAVWKRQLKAPCAIVVALGIVELGAMDVEFARTEGCVQCNLDYERD